ncbi:MAG: hypothetical protein IT423_21245 [Pirellulaceae bacterium]|nr:hypothetical protein [Pirellulaceae bacterium]
MVVSVSDTLPPPASLSGRRVTLVLLAILLGTGGLFYWVTVAYGAYNAARRQTDSTWHTLATELDLRYRSIDKRVAQGVDATEIDMRLGEKWRVARDKFSGTSLNSLQITAACELEELIDQLPKPAMAQPASDPLQRALEDFNQAANAQRNVGQTAGSKLLKLLLNLPDPPKFELSAH